MANKLYISSLLLLVALVSSAMAGTIPAPAPIIPPDYVDLTPSSLLADARVDFGIQQTDGYRVTDPNGETFIVDNIEKPECIFYATYVELADDGLTVGSVEVNSNVYIDEVNIGNCQ